MIYGDTKATVKKAFGRELDAIAESLLKDKYHVKGIEVCHSPYEEAANLEIVTEDGFSLTVDIRKDVRFVGAGF